MARTELTVNNLTLGGYTMTAGNANGTAGTADGKYFVNTGNEMIIVYNKNAGAKNLTIPSGKETARGAGYEDEVIAIDPSEFYIGGPYETAPFNQSGNVVHLDFEAAAESDFLVTVFKFTPAG